MSYTTIEHLRALIGAKVLFLNVETTGVVSNKFGAAPEKAYPLWNSPKYDSARIVSIGWYYSDNFQFDGDHTADIKEVIIRLNENIAIPPVTTQIHGINRFIMDRDGIPFENAVKQLQGPILECDYVLGYNTYFDVNILMAELARVCEVNLLNKLQDMAMSEEILCLGILSAQYARPPQWQPKLTYQMPKQIDVAAYCLAGSPSLADKTRDDVRIARSLAKWIFDNNSSSNEPNEESNTEEKKTETSPKPRTDRILPMSVDDRPWLYENGAATYQPIDNPGKWMLFYPKREMDAQWCIVADAVKNGKFVGVFLTKCSTAWENPRASDKNSGVICMYCSNSENEENIMKIGRTIRDYMKYPRTLYYKTDEQTARGTRATGATHNYSYKLNP